MSRDPAKPRTCALCERPADQGCLRCGERMCEGHLPLPDRRCPSCEAEYLGGRPPLPWRIFRASPASLSGALIGGLLAVPTFVVGLDVGAACVLGGAAAGAGFAGRLFDRWRERRRRLRFLREPDLPQARLLKEPDSSP